MAEHREQLSELLSAYLDGEVSPREKETVEQALRADPAARSLLEELRQTADALGGLPRHPAPPNIGPDLDAYLERTQLLGGSARATKGTRRSKVWWGGPVRAAAMLAVVVGAGWWYLSVQQEPRQAEQLAQSPKPTTQTMAGAELRVLTGTKGDVESQLAGGVDPIVLVNQSFESEQVRLRVTARSAGERDKMVRSFASQLAQVSAENLAQREGAASKAPVGAFFIEGKAGTNYQAPNERQMLVRVQRAEAEKIIDQLSTSSGVPGDQLALQAGPVVAQGTDKARGLMQMLVQKDQESMPPPITIQERDGQVAGGRSPATSLVDTLGEIVGMGSVMKDPKVKSVLDQAEVAKESKGEGQSLASSSPANAQKYASSGADQVDEVIDSAHRPLVERRMERARAAAESQGNVGVQDVTAKSTQAPQPTKRGPESEFITMVVEFAAPPESTAPKPQPPAQPAKQSK